MTPFDVLWLTVFNAIGAILVLWYIGSSRIDPSE